MLGSSASRWCLATLRLAGTAGRRCWHQASAASAGAHPAGTAGLSPAYRAINKVWHDVSDGAVNCRACALSPARCTAASGEASRLPEAARHASGRNMVDGQCTGHESRRLGWGTLGGREVALGGRREAQASKSISKQNVWTEPAASTKCSARALS